jgi:nitrate reductase NapD
MRAEWHISSLVIHAFPTALMLVLAELDAIDGLEVHAATRDGRVVATLETPHESDILAALARINGLEGVLSVALAYHHVDAARTPLPPKHCE